MKYLMAPFLAGIILGTLGFLIVAAIRNATGLGHTSDVGLGVALFAGFLLSRVFAPGWMPTPRGLSSPIGPLRVPVRIEVESDKVLVALRAMGRKVGRLAKRIEHYADIAAQADLSLRRKVDGMESFYSSRIVGTGFAQPVVPARPPAEPAKGRSPKAINADLYRKHLVATPLYLHLWSDVDNELGELLPARVEPGPALPEETRFVGPTFRPYSTFDAADGRHGPYFHTRKGFLRWYYSGKPELPFYTSP